MPQADIDPPTIDIVDALTAARLLPVLVLDDARSAVPLGLALRAGGAALAEVTLRTDAAPRAIRLFAEETDLIVGAGTVLTASDVDVAVGAGARFIVCPGLSHGVLRRCRELGMPVVPGVATPTEIMAALDEGIDVVKFFPARELGGPPTIRALSAPFRGVRFVPTGGITATDMADYLAIPAVVAVGGSWIATRDLVAAEDWDEVTRRTAAATDGEG